MAIIIIKTAKITDITIITVVNFFLFAFVGVIPSLFENVSLGVKCEKGRKDIG